MSFDWRKDKLWQSLSDDQKLAAMALMEADRMNVRDAKNITHAIYNRSRINPDKTLGQHLETGGRRAGLYQPLWEHGQYKRLPQILKSKEFAEVLDYGRQVQSGSVADPTGGATRYLAHARTMEKLSGGVHYSKRHGALRGNSRKYYSWPEWSGYDPETRDYKGKKFEDGSHSFVTPDEDVQRAKKYNVVLGEDPETKAHRFRVDQEFNARLKAEIDSGNAIYTPEDVGKYPPFSEANEFDNAEEVIPQDLEPNAQPQDIPVNAVQPRGQDNIVTPAAQPLPPVEVQQEPDGRSAEEALSLPGQDKPIVQRQIERMEDSAGTPMPQVNLTRDSRSFTATGDWVTREQELERERKAQGSSNLDVFKAAWSDYTVIPNLVARGQLENDSYGRPADPNFKPTVEMFKKIPEEHWDIMEWATSQEDWDARAEYVKGLMEDRKILEESSWAQAILIGGIPMLAEGMPLGWGAVKIAGAGYKAFAQTSRFLETNAGRLAFNSIVGAAEGGSYGYAGKIGGQNEEGGIVAGIVLGGVLSGAFGGYVGRTARGAREATEDAIAEATRKRRAQLREEAAADIDAAKDMPKPPPKDESADMEFNGDVPRRPIDHEMSYEVRRRQSADEAVEAARHYEADTKSLWDYFDDFKYKDPALIADAVRAFGRQGYDLAESIQVYVPTGGELADILNAGIAKGFRTIEDALAAAKSMGIDNPHFAKVSLKAGAKVFEAGQARTGVGRGSEIIFGNGSVSVPKNAKAKTIDGGHTVTNMTLKSKGAKHKPHRTFANPQDVHGQNLRGKDFENFAKDLAEKGDESDLWKTGQAGDHTSIAGAGRPGVDLRNPNPIPKNVRITKPTGIISGINSGLTKAFRDASDRISKEGWWDGAWGFALDRGSQLAHHNNPGVRATARALFGMTQELTEKQRKAGMVRLEATDEMRQRIHEKFDTMLSDKVAEVKKKYFEKHEAKLSERHEAWVTFNQAVSDYMDAWQYHGDIKGVGYDPDVVEFAHWLDNEFFLPYFKMQQDPGMIIGRPGEFDAIADMANATREAGYFPRVYDVENAFSRVIQQSGNDGMPMEILNAALYSGMLKMGKVAKDQAAKKANPKNFTKAEIKLLAQHMRDVIFKAKGGWQSWADGLTGHASPQELIGMMKKYNEFAADADKIDEDLFMRFAEAVSFANKQDAGQKAGSQTFYRSFLDPTAVVEDAKGQKWKLRDLTLRDAEQVARHYSHRVSGHVALGATDIIDDAGNVLQHGIRGSDDWKNVMNAIGEIQLELNAKGQGEGFLAKHAGSSWTAEGMLIDGYQHITNTYPNETPTYLQIAKNLTWGRTLGGAGFTQFAEGVNHISEYGADAFKNIPELTGAFNAVRQLGPRALKDKDGVIAMHAMIDMLGAGTSMRRGVQAARAEGGHMSNIERGTAHVIGEDFHDRLLRHSQTFAQGIMKYSGLSPITDMQQRHAINTFANQLADWATRYKTFDQIPRHKSDIFADIGLSPKDVDGVLAMFRDPEFIVKKNDYAIKGFYVTKNAQMDMMNRVFGAYRQRATNLIQSNKWSTLMPGSSHPWARAILLLQTFALASFKAQLVPNFQKFARHAGRFRDAAHWEGVGGQADALAGMGKVGVHLIGNMVSGAAMYGLGYSLYNFNADDADEKWDKFWEPQQLLLAGISRAGWLAWLPLVWDSVAAPMVGKSLSGYRTSLSAPGIMDGPMWSTFGDIGRAAKSAYNIATDDATTKDYNNQLRLVTNLWVAKALLQAGVRQMGIEEPDSRPPPASLLEGFGAFSDE